jgi:hypothetical protein
LQAVRGYLAPVIGNRLRSSDRAQVFLQASDEFRPRNEAVTLAMPCAIRVFEVSGVGPVGVDQAAEERANQQTNLHLPDR